MRRVAGVAGVVVTLMVLSACETTDETPTPVVKGKLSLRVAHASPDAPAVDVYAKGNATPLLRGLAYGQQSDWLQIEEGAYVIELRAAGAEASAPAAFTTGTLNLAKDQKVTAVAAGLLTSTEDARRFRVIPVIDSYGEAMAGKIRVRILHASPDAPAVGIDVGDDGSPEIASLAPWADTGADGVELPADTALQVGVGAAGYTRVTAFTVPPLPEKTNVLIVASGLLGRPAREADGFSLFAMPPSGAAARIKQNPTLHALHGSPNAPMVDIFAGSAKLIESLDFAQLSKTIQVPPGAYTLDFFAHSAGSARPSGSPAASATTPALEAGERYLAIAAGYLGASGGKQPFQLLAVRETFDASSTDAMVGVIHASPDAPAVDIGPADGTSVTALDGLRALDFAATGTSAVPTSPFVLGIAVADTSQAVVRYPLSPEANQRLFGVAIGALSPASGEKPFTLVLVDASEPAWTATVVTPLM